MSNWVKKVISETPCASEAKENKEQKDRVLQCEDLTLVLVLRTGLLILDESWHFPSFCFPQGQHGEKIMSLTVLERTMKERGKYACSVNGRAPQSCPCPHSWADNDPCFCGPVLAGVLAEIGTGACDFAGEKEMK